MKFIPLAPNGPVLLEPIVHEDHRGFFMETFRCSEFEEHCGNYKFVQDNHSKSLANVLRGLHYQHQHPQGKLIRVIVGEVFDVAVDLRESSPTFGQYFSTVLSSANKKMFWVPPKFAHGFLVLSQEAEFLYKCTDYYAPTDEHCLLYNDPELNIEWPAISGSYITSPKDALGKSFKDCLKFS
ncbi:MAG: dTDP-4-dehydrorhamnose 3,5-epimerase [Desulfovibrio sp.]|nr:dTDP-4-dehydrorhamnose 3,5-epimerase [Desulfovibrio sp.]